jgi:septal ring factor EnvC (AmiA/AmiB activator)
LRLCCQSPFYVSQTVRLESQVKRFKTAAENLEKVEEELKAEKRKFQKEVRFLYFTTISHSSTKTEFCEMSLHAMNSLTDLWISTGALSIYDSWKEDQRQLTNYLATLERFP